MRKCAAYIRVSKGIVQQGTSIVNQKAFLIQRAKENIPFTIPSLTPEIINKFINRIEISENGDAKIFYRFSTPDISA
ncbi:hypothetical protein FDB28_03775 [Clostridium botulinum]|nr:hypothetical protein [Clostridium botulinum]NFS97582.1 hypothetical protein [Clostridium botulinum]